MRRYVRALGHEAHVAQRTRVDDGLKIRAGDAFDLAGRRRIDQIEEPGKAIAEIEATTAGMTYIEDPSKFGINPIGIVKLLVPPGDRMAGGSFQASFTHSNRPFRLG